MVILSRPQRVVNVLLICTSHFSQVNVASSSRWHQTWAYNTTLSWLQKIRNLHRSENLTNGVYACFIHSVLLIAVLYNLKYASIARDPLAEPINVAWLTTWKIIVSIITFWMNYMYCGPVIYTGVSLYMTSTRNQFLRGCDRSAIYSAFFHRRGAVP